ncbi:hypothetical protein L7F22_013424 [Adiantum nelumboides]|nr:hypothetical protein [Adiantum nelumboides]
MGIDTTVVSSTDAIVNDMVVDACTDAIADATIVDACTNDIVDAMEVDASTDDGADGNVNDGGIESIVCAVIDAILDAIEAMGTNATVQDTRGMGEEVLIEREAETPQAEVVCPSDTTIEDTRGMGEEVLIDREAVTREVVDASDVTAQAKVVCPSDAMVEDTRGRGEEVLIEREAGTCEVVGASDVTAKADVVCPSDAADDIVDAEEAKGTDAAVEDMRGLGEEDLTKRIPGIGSIVGNDDVTASTNTAEAGDSAVQSREAMGEAVVVATDMKEANTHNTIEACIEQNNEVGKGTKVPTYRAAQSRETMGEDTNKAGTKNANKEAKKGHESEGQERLKCLVVMPVQIVALPPASCEEKKRRDNLCIILDVNGLLIRIYKVSFYKGIARSSTLDLARSKYQCPPVSVNEPAQPVVTNTAPSAGSANANVMASSSSPAASVSNAKFRLNTGRHIPAVGLGTVNFTCSEDEVFAAILHAIQIGYRHIDTAKYYGTERAIGRALQRAFESGVVTREDMFITSKLWCDDNHPDDVLPALQNSLRALGLEFLDLYLMHFPVRLAKGARIPPKEHEFLPVDVVATWRAMETCQQLGLSRAIGVSNFSSCKLTTLLRSARVVPAVNQVEVHPLWQQQKLREFCQMQGVHVSAWSPLGAPGTKYGSIEVLTHPTVAHLAHLYSKSTSQIVLKWALQNGISVLPKSYNPSHQLDNLQLWDWDLKMEDMELMSTLSQRRISTCDYFCNETTSPFKSTNELWDEDE